jgi:hypothetical protein
MMTLEQIIAEVKTLFLEERQTLIHIIVDSFTPVPSPQISLKSFRGLAEHQRDMDAQDYVTQLRDEWDN